MSEKRMLFWTIGVGTILLLPFIHHYNKKHNRITADGVSRQLDAVNRESKIRMISGCGTTVALTPFKKKRSQVRFADEQTSVINHEVLLSNSLLFYRVTLRWKWSFLTSPNLILLIVPL